MCFVNWDLFLPDVTIFSTKFLLEITTCMEIIYKVLTMYGIAFCIAMFVAFIIWFMTFVINNDLTKLSFYKGLFKPNQIIKDSKPEIS
jgi:hypothetical protein